MIGTYITNQTNADGSQQTIISFGQSVSEAEAGNVTIFVKAGNEVLINKLERAVKRELNKHEKSH